MIGYHVKGGVTFYLFFRATSPVMVHIGILPGDAIDYVNIFYGFTYTEADVAVLTEHIGDAWFYTTYGIPETEEAAYGA